MTGRDSSAVAFVTGASRGIGKAAAVALGAAGFAVAVTARTLHDGEGRVDSHPGVVVPGSLEATMSLVEAGGGTALAIEADLLDQGSLDAAVQSTFDRFGRIDVLVNNAIYQGPGSLEEFLDVDDAEMRRMFEGNVFAQLALLRLILPQMVARGSGTVVNLISPSGYLDPTAKLGEGGWSMPYAMTKAAFGRVSPLLHVELGDRGIRAFSLDPGLVLNEKAYATNRAEQFAGRYRSTPPEAIGAVIAWLAVSADADELRGQVVKAPKECARRNLLDGWPAGED
jgi:NAD(P)-dependent dehydrogenase (short-subunit alcohol dehydrogenase family)